MTQLALIRIEDNQVISTAEEGKGRVLIPGVGDVSPPISGWEGGGEIITTEGPARFRLVPLTPLEIPDGKRVIGERRIVSDGKEAWFETEVEDIPPPPPPEPAQELTRTEKLDRLLGDYGLSRDDLKAELAGDEPAEDVKVR
jgi:hypothetical protein